MVPSDPLGKWDFPGLSVPFSLEKETAPGFGALPSPTSLTPPPLPQDWAPRCPRCCPLCDCACACQLPDCQSLNCLCFEIKLR